MFIDDAVERLVAEAEGAVCWQRVEVGTEAHVDEGVGMTAIGADGIGAI